MEVKRHRYTEWVRGERVRKGRRVRGEGELAVIQVIWLVKSLTIAAKFCWGLQRQEYWHTSSTSEESGRAP